MAANLTEKLGTTTTLTCTLTSLASSATGGRESATVDNTTDLFLDVLVWMKAKPQNSGSIANDKAIYVYAWGSLNNTDFPDAVTGADAAITLNDPTQLRLIGVLNVAAINVSYSSEPLSLASAFGGVVPPYWGLVIRNYCGTALSATGTDHVIKYRGIYGQSV